ncbi:hypothetical protein B0O99DRAFT_684422 [Bisporella sp. PMI_857]|nr:hypothetical protein B0O99DRAFT_684422 [Bisporella sp. PMI_857]
MVKADVGTRLIVACDGTWQSASTGPPAETTNVTHFCRALVSHDLRQGNRRKRKQIVFHQSGVGSETTISPLRHMFVGSTGSGLEDHSREAYMFITDNYKKGDEIFLFGFSRGAYTARTIAAFIGAIGVLNPSGMEFYKSIYELYKNAKTDKQWDLSVEEFVRINKLDEFQWRTPPAEVIIKVVGCWETVGALGVPKTTILDWLGLNDGYNFLDIQLPPRVEYAFQALALDEHRSSFYPTIWHLDPKAEAIYDSSGDVIEPMLIQCWFPGHHNDVGGNDAEHKTANSALAWMVDQCQSRGLLQFDMEYLKEQTQKTRNQSRCWTTNRDPFTASLISNAFWSLLGSRVRRPGREPVPRGASPATVRSKTYEYIHYSLREKMTELAKLRRSNLPNCELCTKENKIPSISMRNYEFDAERKEWVLRGKDGKIKPECTLREYPRPLKDDPESLQAWLSSEWLREDEAKDYQRMMITAVAGKSEGIVMTKRTKSVMGKKRN